MRTALHAAVVSSVILWCGLAQAGEWPIQHTSEKDNFTDIVTERIIAGNDYPLGYGGKVHVEAQCVNGQSIVFKFTINDVLGLGNAVTVFNPMGAEYRIDNGQVKQLLAVVKDNIAAVSILAEENDYSPSVKEILQSKQIRLRLYVDRDTAQGIPVVMDIITADLQPFFAECPLSSSAMNSVKPQAVIEKEINGESDGVFSISGVPLYIDGKQSNAGMVILSPDLLGQVKNVKKLGDALHILGPAYIAPDDNLHIAHWHFQNGLMLTLWPQGGEALDDAVSVSARPDCGVAANKCMDLILNRKAQ